MKNINKMWILLSVIAAAPTLGEQGSCGDGFHVESSPKLGDHCVVNTRGQDRRQERRDQRNNR